MRLPALCVSILCLAAPAILPARAAAQDLPRPVRLFTVAPPEASLQRSLPGRVRALQSVDLAFQVPGQLNRLEVAQGQQVAQGEVIAQLDLDQYQRRLDEAETNLQRTRRNAERLEPLAGASVPRAEVADARDGLTLAQIQREQAADDLAHATLRAPFDGLIARREVANYTTVSAGQPIVRLHDMSALLIDISIPEVLVRSADPASLGFEAVFAGSDQVHPLDLEEFEADSRDAQQTFLVSLRFREAPGPLVFPGLSATVRITQQAPDANGLLIPETALVFGADRGTRVFVYEPGPDGDQGVLRGRAVEVRMGDDGLPRIVRGLQPGERIAAAGGALLAEGMPARPFVAMGQ